MDGLRRPCDRPEKYQNGLPSHELQGEQKSQRRQNLMPDFPEGQKQASCLCSPQKPVFRVSSLLSRKAVGSQALQKQISPDRESQPKPHQQPAEYRNAILPGSFSGGPDGNLSQCRAASDIHLPFLTTPPTPQSCQKCNFLRTYHGSFSKDLPSLHVFTAISDVGTAGDRHPYFHPISFFFSFFNRNDRIGPLRQQSTRHNLRASTCGDLFGDRKS